MFGKKISIRKFYGGKIEFKVGNDVAIGTLGDDWSWKLISSESTEMMGRIGFALEKAGEKGIKKAFNNRELIIGKV